GRHGTTVPVTDIAEAAGVSKGGLLYHFPNKETLLNGVATNLMYERRSETGVVGEGEMQRSSSPKEHRCDRPLP
ncbi:TetR/AcrR family transcriptional regulator, partial [Microbacterium sp. BF1]|uniref:TetR/AcrR family transcriptional regulator n=1 Tax=Microbacterium sp. BF1 TaxID=2821146 RepID=UPI001C4E06D9